MTTQPVVDVRALAELARLAVTESELAKLQAEIPGILGFVETIQKVVADVPKAQVPPLHNVMRDDINPTPSGTYTEVLLAAAPTRQGNRVAVKQVLHKK
jgi:aspartyl-tRNA(Asn)/glutamyl-tRNA(Gln) amidotransferase subunit C